MPPYKTEYMLDLFIIGPLWEYAMGMGLIVVIVPPLLHFLFLFSGDFPVPDRQTSWLPQSSAVVALIGTRQSQTGGWQGLWSSSCPRIGWWDAFIQDLRLQRPIVVPGTTWGSAIGVVRECWQTKQAPVEDLNCPLVFHDLPHWNSKLNHLKA